MTTIGSFRVEPAELLAHDQWLRALARSLVHGVDVDDLVQDTWLAAAVRCPDQNRPLRWWLATVLRRLAARRRRAAARRRSHELGLQPGDDVPSTEATVALIELQQRVAATVAVMSEPYRTTVLLRFFHGLPHSEIAARTGQREDTVRKRLERGIELLRAELQRHDPCWRQAPAIVALAGPVKLPWTWLSGALLMGNALKCGVAVTLLVIAGLALWASAGDPGGTPTTSPPRAAQSSRMSAERASSTTATAALKREAVSAPTPAAQTEQTSPSYTGRVLDLHGQPLGGVPIVVAESVREHADAETNRMRDRLPEAVMHQLWPERLPRDAAPDLTALTVLAHSAEDGSFTIAAPPHGYALAGSGWVTLRATPLGSSWGAQILIVAAPSVALGGQVVDGSGQPLGGVLIEASKPVLGDFPAVLDATRILGPVPQHSRADGSFVVPDLPAGMGSVAFHCDGYGSAAVETPLATRMGERVVLPRLATARLIVAGTVVDQSDVPVNSAMVGFGELAVHSDGQGRFELIYSADVPGQTSSLFAAKPGYQTLVLSGFGGMLKGRECRDLMLRLPGPSLAIFGRVVDAGGAPVEGARVYPWNEPVLLSGRTAEELGMSSDVPVQPIGPGIRACATTNHDGAFVLGGLRSQDYALHVLLQQPRAGFTISPIPAGSRGVELRAPADLIHDRIAGRVVDRAGTPVAGVMLSPSLAIYLVPNEGRYGDGLRGTSSDADGRFELSDVPRVDFAIYYSGGSVVPGSFVIDPARPLLDQRIVVVGLRHLRIITEPTRGATAFRVLNGRDKELTILELTPGGSAGRNRWPLREGQSGTLAVAEDATSVVLENEQGEIVRLPVHLRAGEVIDVRY